MISKSEAKERIDKLKELINKYSYHYHVEDHPVVSDAVWDGLKNELEELERQFPELITPDSPTQKVNSTPLDKFKKVMHRVPMLSLHDAFDEKEIREWEERIKKFVPDEKLDYFCELKMDGLAASLVYEKGTLIRGATRGDGKIGEDVTQNLKTIASIPLILRIPQTSELVRLGISGKKAEKLISQIKTGIIEIRGEAIMTKKVFERLNTSLGAEGKNLLANPRNAAAGSIRQLDSKITSSRMLDFYAYSLVTDLGHTRHSDEHGLAKFLGFKTISYNERCEEIEDVVRFHEYWKGHVSELPFECDGIVVVVNKVAAQERIGTVGKAPRWMIAYKFPAEEATTILEGIKIQVGRTGVLTPVAMLKPVRVRGVMISRATLHNEDEIRRLDLKIGDSVVVGRAGDVIPDVKKVLKELRTGKERPYRMPVKCPICKSLARKDKGGIILRCENKKCLSRQRKSIYYFASRSAFNIEGLGPKIIDALLDQNLIQDPADLFELKEGDLVPLERFAEKSAENLVKSIDLKRKITLPRFITSLGIVQHMAQYIHILKDELKILGCSRH
ncbi:NAD-dependent DNA ligase LigA [Patescibacteria group bacterium]